MIEVESDFISCHINEAERLFNFISIDQIYTARYVAWYFVSRITLFTVYSSFAYTTTAAVALNSFLYTSALPVK